MIIIIIIILITFMQDIYNYIPERNHVSRVYSVAAVVFTICATCNVISHVTYVLYFYTGTFRSMCAVQFSAGVYCCWRYVQYAIF